MNDNTAKPLPKSLHTVTAIIRVAQHLRTVDAFATRLYLIDRALQILGYGASHDPHFLAAKALAMWAREEEG